MLCRHMPGGAHGILSLLTVVFVLPEGECCSPRGAVGSQVPSSLNPSSPGVIYPWGEFRATSPKTWGRVLVGLGWRQCHRVLYKRAVRQDLGSPGLLFPDLAGAGTPIAVPGCVRVLTTPKTPMGAQEGLTRALALTQR